MNLSVDVISDPICPWCFLGKRRLEKAIGVLRSEVQGRTALARRASEEEVGPSLALRANVLVP